MITHERLQELLSYNPCTGMFHWKVNRRCVQVGQAAGSISIYGYNTIRVDGKLYRAARLAWFYIYKKWPDIIDHIDRDRRNDSIWNISNGTQRDNARNSSIYKKGKPRIFRLRPAHQRNWRYASKRWG